MKKIIALILCLAMVLSFAACGNKDAADTTGADTTAPATTMATTPAETEAEAIQPVETKPVETQPEETKPEETKPKETKPTQPQPTVPPTTQGATEPTTPSIQKLSQKEQFEALTGVVGMHLFDAVAKLGWKESEIQEEETCLYASPMTVYLDGTKYQVLLGVSEDNNKVSEVLYRAELSFKALEVAKAALKIVDTLDQWVGKDKQLETDGSFALRDTTEVDVSAGLSIDDFAYCMVSWDYSKQATKTQLDFVKGYGEGVAFGVFLEVSRFCIKEEDKVISDTCMIDFSVGVIPAP